MNATALPDNTPAENIEWLMELFRHIDEPEYLAAQNAKLKEAAAEIPAAPQPKRIPCPRCAGGGKFYEFRHVAGGICFRCKGAQFIAA